MWATDIFYTFHSTERGRGSTTACNLQDTQSEIVYSTDNTRLQLSHDDKVKGKNSPNLVQEVSDLQEPRPTDRNQLKPTVS